MGEKELVYSIGQCALPFHSQRWILVFEPVINVLHFIRNLSQACHLHCKVCDHSNIYCDDCVCVCRDDDFGASCQATRSSMISVLTYLLTIYTPHM